MAVVVLASAAGSPGVTCTAVGLASVWPRPVLLVEADPSGGAAILAGFFQARIQPGSGLTDVAIGHRTGDLAGALAASAVALPGTRAQVVPGPYGHAAARTLGSFWPALLGELRALEETGQDVLVDAGRLGLVGSPEPLIYGADLALLVVGSSLVAMSSARSWAGTWRATFDDVGSGAAAAAALVVGAGRPYSRREIGRVLPIGMLGEVAWDPGAAEVLAHGAAPGRRFRQSRLVRSLQETQEAITAAIARNRSELGAAGELGASGDLGVPGPAPAEQS